MKNTFGQIGYISANQYYTKLFGQKVTKIPVDCGFTCPNRDGVKGFGGCIFCSEKGSGDFSGNRDYCGTGVLSLSEQYESYKKLIAQKWKDTKYIIYFQAFTNTYAKAEALRALYEEALSLPDVVGISIATRPDCFSEEIYSLLKYLGKKTYVMVELGLQTSNEQTAKMINRCFPNKDFVECVKVLRSINIDVCAHIILGLPGESASDMLKSVSYAVSCGINGIKLQLLHVLKGTALCEMYEKAEFSVLSQEEYLYILCNILETIPEDVVVHRLTGDGDKRSLVAPKWSENKKNVLNSINREIAQRNKKTQVIK